MKAMLWIGVLLLGLGVVSLFVTLPHTEDHTLQAGNMKIGVQTQTDEKVSPVISATLIVAGAVLAIVGARGSKS
jgi:Zn-dependent membrane protease YugP